MEAYRMENGGAAVELAAKEAGFGLALAVEDASGRWRDVANAEYPIELFYESPEEGNVTKASFGEVRYVPEGLIATAAFCVLRDNRWQVALRLRRDAAVGFVGEYVV